MTRKEFDEIIELRIEKIKSTLISKGKEYATDKDVMHNFKRAGLIAGITPEKALYGFLLKHLTSVADILDRIDQGYLPDDEVIDQKIGDVLNYFILLEGLIKDHKNNQ